MNKYFISLFVTLSLVLTAGILYSCKKDNGGGSKPDAPYVEIPKDVIDFKSDETSPRSISIRTNVDYWTAKSSESWCHVRRSGKVLHIQLDRSTDFKIRQAKITLTFGEIVKTITIRQLGSEPTILVDRQILMVSAAGGGLDFVVTTNVDVTLKLPSWIVKPSESRSAELKKLKFDYVAEPNPSDQPRTENIEVISSTLSEGQTAPTTVRIAVTQKGISNYDPSNADDIKGDLKLKVVRGTATSYQSNGGEIENSFDNNYETIYHSNWSNGGEGYFPITLTYTLENESEVDYLIYHPRKKGNDNGNFRRVAIAYSLDGVEYKDLVERDFGGTKEPARVEFAGGPIRAKHFRFVVKSGSGDGQGFAACSEMEFYAKRPDAFDYKSLFTDELCTDLKPGITEEDVKACKYPFYRNLAYHMLKDRYDREFRVAEFKAWADPRIMSATHKTNPYSLLDNPTGISVKENEDLVIFVGETHGHDRLAIRVQNLNKPGGDGFGDGITYPLHKGVNKIRMTRPGLVYVMYHTSTLEAAETAKPIKMHFASGRVNGYYDNEKPEHKGRWKELLDKAVDPYFDVLGKFVHLTFPTSSYKEFVPSGEALAKKYDAVVDAEMHLLGLYQKGRRPFANRMYMHVMYHQYMYATSYHTGYNVTTAKEVLSIEGVSIWGPAHEIGHMNQTRPGMMWIGMTECTVNIKSAYVQTTVFNHPCRVQVENMNSARPHNRYTKAWNEIIIPELPHSYGPDDDKTSGQNLRKSDVFVQLIPFWQLELYFGKVLGRTPSLQPGGDKGGFYPDLYEYFRTHDSAPRPQHGHHQTEFAYAVSLISGYDMTDFFVKWGFLRPVNKVVNDYGEGRLEVSEARVAEVKKRIADLKLPKLGNIPIEYITDVNYPLFKTNPKVVAGKYTVDNGVVTLTGWKNVVVFEVIEKDSGKVVYVGDGILEASDKPKLYLPDSIQWSKDKYKVVAVSSTGERVDAAQ